jgi:hypothetical protein
MNRTRMARTLASLAAAASTIASAAGPAPAPSASAASAPHVSPYIRAARQHAQQASGPALKVNLLVQHRPRMPASTRNG